MRSAIVGLIWMCGSSATGCYAAAGDDDASPTASSIPTAARSAVGADYPSPGSGLGSGTTGIAECDAYFRKIKMCKSLPPSSRTAIEDAAKSMREAIGQATSPEAKEALGEACKQAADALSVCDTNL